MSTTPTVGVTHSGYNSLDLARRINEEYPTPKHSPSTQHYPRPHRGRTSRSHSDPKLQVKDHKSSVSRYVPPIPTGILDDPSSAASAESSTTDANNPPSGLIRSLSTPSAPHRVNSHTPSPLPPVTTRSYSATDQTRKPKMDTNNGHHRNGTGAPDRQPLLSSNEDDPASRRRAESLRRKLRTYEAILALRNGCMPDTEQMVAWGRHALRSSALDSRNRKLSPKGRELIRDARAWVEALMDLALTKNYDDKLQEFIWFTSRAGMKTGGADVGAAVRAGASGGGKDLGRLMERLRGLVGLLWSSEEFRGLLNEFTDVGRDMFADAASHVAAVAAQAAESAKAVEEEVEDQEGNVGEISGKGIKEKGVALTDSARRAGHQARDDLETYLREKFPKQRRDAAVARMKKVVQDIQQNTDFQEMVDFVVELLRGYVKRIGAGVQEEGGKTEVLVDENFETAMKFLKSILMSFAGGKPLDPINEALRKVIDDIQNDKDLKEFYDNVAHEFNQLMTRKGYVTSDSADAEAHRLYERSQELLNEKQDRYRPDVENLFAEIRSFLDAIRNDRESQRLAETSRKVYNDLVRTDRSGAFRGFRKRVLWDLLETVFPRLVDEVRYVPIPRIEYQDHDFDLILENVVLESEHFLPTRTVLEAFTRLEITNSYTVSSSHVTTTHLHASNINLFCRDAAFIMRKKTGLVKFSDRGLIDLFITDRGASADLVLESTSHDADDDEDPSEDSYFRVKSVRVKIDDFSYNYRAYHTWAAATLAPVLRPAIRKLLSRVLEARIKNALESVDREIFAAAERMRVASIASRGGGSVEAWIRAVMSRPERSRRRGGRGEWRVSLEDDGGLMFPGEFPPGGVVGKMRRAEERVEEGQEEGTWRNDVF